VVFTVPPPPRGYAIRACSLYMFNLYIHTTQWLCD